MAYEKYINESVCRSSFARCLLFTVRHLCRGTRPRRKAGRCMVPPEIPPSSGNRDPTNPGRAWPPVGDRRSLELSTVRGRAGGVTSEFG